MEASGQPTAPQVPHHDCAAEAAPSAPPANPGNTQALFVAVELALQQADKGLTVWQRHGDWLLPVVMISGHAALLSLAALLAFFN